MTIHLALVDGRMRDETSTAHVSPEHVAAYLHGRLTGADRERAVSHFARCAECRRELTELGDLVPTKRAPRSWRLITASAAAIVAFVVLPRVVGDNENGVGRVRTDQDIRLPSGTLAIAIVAPAERTTIARTDITLTWHPVAQGATYTVTVQDSSGTEVWKRAALLDTSITVPDSARLHPGQFYFWSVDARLPDGTTANTGVRTFTVR